MSAEIIPFDFEEQAVRVVMRDDEPWFVAADICRVLEIRNTSDAVKRLDEDEVTLDQIEGSHRETNLVSESGLYALVIRSDKPAAKRFRKWITAEVLPAIRRTGRYDHDLPTSEAAVTGDIAGVPIREAELWLQMVREARLSRGTRAAVSIWDRSPLPRLSPVQNDAMDPAEGRACLGHIMGQSGDLVVLAQTGSEDANTELAGIGLRAVHDGLFVGNGSLPVFEGTRWGGGLQRLALLALPGAHPSRNPLTLAGARMRGVIVPWTACEEVA